MSLRPGSRCRSQAIRAQIASAVNLIVQAKPPAGRSRRMVSITEIPAWRADVISMQEVFRVHASALTPDNKIIGHFTATGVRSHYAERFSTVGLHLPAASSKPFVAAQ